MGISQSSLNTIRQHFPPNKFSWIPYQQTSQSTNMNNNQQNNSLVFDQRTMSIMGQKYTIKNYEQINYQLQAFLFRKNNSSCIVEVIDVRIGQQSMQSMLPFVSIPDCMLVGSQKQPITIILQHIPYRLGDVGMLTFQQMIYVMGQCLMALHFLYINYCKAFYIDEDLVCFNSRGQCKLWVNQHLQRNKPNIQANFLPKTVIEQVFELLESRVCQQTVPEIYYILKAKIQFQKFRNAIKFIQKVKKHQRIKTNCIKSLIVKTKHHYIPSQSDSIKALNNNKNLKKHQQIVIRNKSTDNNKRTIKYSLKNSKHHLIQSKIKNNYYCTPTTTASKEQHTQMSIKQQLQRFDQNQCWMANKNDMLLRTTHKSDRMSHTIKPQHNYTTHYSQKKPIYNYKDEDSLKNQHKFSYIESGSYSKKLFGSQM